MSEPSLLDHGASEVAEPNDWLWQSFARSVRDNVVAEVVVQTLRIVGMIILARALSPDDFGLFKVLLVVSAFAMLTNESGIPDALIQRKDLRAVHQSTAWWICIGLALMAAAALYVSAPTLEGWMKMPGLSFGARLLCIPIVLEGAAVTANAHLRRQMRFSALAVADVIAEIAFLGGALIFLWEGWPRWALAVGLFGRFVAHAISVLIVGGRAGLPLGLPRIAAARELSRFSTNAFGARLIYALSYNADFLMVGRLLGSSALGFYSMAWDLLRFVPDRVYKVAGRVTLPAFCHLQDQPEQLAQAFLNFCNYVARIVLPIVICAAIAAPQLIETIYGAKWLPSAVPMQLLSVGLVLVGMRIAIGSVYFAKNRPEFDIYLHTLRLVLIVVVILAVASTGIWGVSIGMSAVEAVISIIGLGLACKLIGLGLSDLLSASMPGIQLAAICAVATVAGKLVAITAGVEGPLSLLIIAAPPAVVYCWRESSVALQMFADAFGGGRIAPSQVLEEPR